jgi:hypothetical protein
MLGLGIPTLAARSPLGPVPPLPPPASLTNIVIEGDSLTNQVPGDSAASAQRWPWLYQAVRPAGTATPIRAQGSRYVGDVSMLDDGSNTLFGNVTEDATTHGGQLIWAAPFLTNDFGTAFHGAAGASRAATIKARLATYWQQVKARGCKLAFGFAPPLRTDAANPDWNATRAAFVPDFRDPAVWSQYCDYYVPVGEQPDFNAADNTALIDAGDKVHPTDAGQLKLLEANRPALDTLFDAARVGSTTMYPAAWPTGATGLAPSTQVSRRFVVSGIAHKGLALTGAAALSATNAELRVNGGAWAATGSGWLYNGDTIDLRLTTSAAADTAVAVALTVGSETRTLSFRTATGTTAPVGYVHGDVQGSAPQSAVHAYAARPFAAAGIAVIGLVARAGATGVMVGGTAAVRRATQVGVYGEMTLELWTAPIAAAGPKDLTVTFAAAQNKSAVSWGVVTGASADAILSAANAADGSDPHGTGEVSVPANGLALGVFGEYGGPTITPALVIGGTGVDEGSIGFQGESFGLALAQRATSGALAWNFGYGPYPVAALVFTPA